MTAHRLSSTVRDSNPNSTHPLPAVHPSAQSTLPADDAPTVRRLSWLSTALAIVLVLEIAGLSFYTWNIFQRETDPERLAQRAERALQQNYPVLRSEFVRQVGQQAPALAGRISDELIEATPTARLELENISVKYLERSLDDAVELSADEFREWLQQNHAIIEDAFVQIGQAPQDARLLMLDTEASLEEQLGVDLRDQAKLALEVYRMLNDKLARLSNPHAELSEQERLERRAVRLLRALAR